MKLLATLLPTALCHAAIALACLALVPSVVHAQAAAAPERLVVLDWTATAMVRSLGIDPVGVGDADLYRIWVGQPPLSQSTWDVGLRDTPSLEAVASLKPELIIVSPLGAAARSALQRIAPTREVAVYSGTGDPLRHAETELQALAKVVGREAQAQAVVTRADTEFASLRQRLAGAAMPRLLVIQFLDKRFVRVYGPSSLFGGVLQRLGLGNAWHAPTNGWGFALVGVERLAAFTDAEIVVVDPLPSEVTLAPDTDSLWGNLPAVKQGRVKRLAATWPFGDLTAAQRFASLLVDAISGNRAADDGNARF
ncbi:ABC transporter substrate-binding protein [Labrys neptuniae]|uniref:ABC transporter substrate-binding protein n=1 Tax=Labrys neptuniae TaxID=376174 RepID=UPI00289233A7|nr:ABC transporter substrate-binding protein [Labrys neptuniae]MDT3380301.1 ABC transporter substrate-binding protein [Labrys neptuniae]